jgi:lysozyme family protein
MQAGKAQLTIDAQGVGRDRDAAQVKAVTKLNATKIYDTFGKACK